MYTEYMVYIHIYIYVRSCRNQWGRRWRLDMCMNHFAVRFFLVQKDCQDVLQVPFMKYCVEGVRDP